MNLLFFNGCRKIDTSISSEAQDLRSPEERFFQIPAAANEKVKAAAKYLQGQNSKREFITIATKNAGYPVWDKAMIVTDSRIEHRSGLVNEDSSAIVYIPFVANGDSTTKAILIVEERATDTIYSTIWPQNYLQLGFDTTKTGWNSRQLFMLFTEFDHSIFDHKTFFVTDGRIFGAGIDDTLIVTRQDPISSNEMSLQRNNYFEVTLCLVYDVQNTNWGIARSNFYGSESLMMPVCGTFYWYEDGNTQVPASPVPSGVTWSQPPPPSGEGGGGVWYPADENLFESAEISNPCDYVDTLVKTAFFQTMVTDLRDSCIASYEIGYDYGNPIASFPTKNYHTGQADSLASAVRIKWSTGKRDGVSHNHNKVIVGKKNLSIFSTDDLMQLYEYYVQNKMTNYKYFSFVLVTDSTSYIIMINDQNDFELFGNAWLKPNKLGKGGLAKYLYSDFPDINSYGVNEDSSATSNEVNFLDKLKKLPFDGCGLKFFKGNSNMTQFSPISVNGNRSIIQSPCN